MSLLSPGVFAAVSWDNDRAYLGSDDGFKVFAVRKEISLTQVTYTLELIGSKKDCQERDRGYYLDMRWSSFLFKCTATNKGLTIVPLTRSGKRRLASVLEDTRQGDYLSIYGLITKTIHSKIQ